jgi:hypothetical protein
MGLWRDISVLRPVRLTSMHCWQIDKSSSVATASLSVEEDAAFVMVADDITAAGGKALALAPRHSSSPWKAQALRYSVSTSMRHFDIDHGD